jgi:multidrug resistance efflux pump
MQIKVKFKEERQGLEGEKKRLQKDLVDSQDKLEFAQKKFHSLKTEVEESPLSVLRNELTSKQMENSDLQKKVEKAHASRDEFKKRFE